MKREQIRMVIIFAISLFFVIMETIIVYSGLHTGHRIWEANGGGHSAGYFAAFTVESNSFVALISVVGVVLSGSCLIRKEYALPKWFDYLYLAGVSSLSLVFVVVAGFLAPLAVLQGKGYFYVFSGWNFFNHFLNPVVAVICFDLMDQFSPVDHQKCWIAAVPMSIYSVLYLVNVVFLKVWPDFYCFSLGGHYHVMPMVVAVLYLVTYGAGRLHVFLHNRGCIGGVSA